MKEEVSAVKTKGKVVGEIVVPTYESLQELIDNVAENEIVDLFNKANKIKLQAEERNKHAEGKTGKQARRRIAFNLLTPDEIAQYAGNYDELQKFIDGPEMQRRVDEQLGASSDESEE